MVMIKYNKVVQDVESYSVSAYLNLISDFTHNFLDGMAISVAFKKNINLGIATTIGIMFHEIPHEISDFAILIKSGFSKCKVY